MADETPVTTTADLTTDPAAVEAELARLRAGQTAEPPAEVEEKPVEKPAEPVVAKPEEKPTETEKRDGAAWALLRKKEKLLAEREQELADLRAKAAAREQPTETATKEPTFETDPAEYLKRKTEATEAEITRLRANEEARNELDNLRSQEAEFAKEHPDYFKATEYLIAKEVEEWEKSGLADLGTRRVLANAQFRGTIERVKSNPEVQRLAEQQNRDPEDLAAHLIARDSWLMRRRGELQEAARETGGNVAANAYELARLRGFSPSQATEAAKVAEQKERDKITHAREVAEAASPLSEGSSTPTAEVRVLRNRNEVLNLDEDSLDALIKSGRFKEL